MFPRISTLPCISATRCREGDRDEDGIGIPANALTLDGATITGPDGTTDADLTHAAVAAEGGHKVDGSLVSPPAVKSISLVSSPARDDTYELGETLRVLVQFDREVTATGRVQVALTIGEETPLATSYGWGSTPFLYFDYIVQAGDKDEDGISVEANSLFLEGATIKGPDGTTDADLAHETVVPEDGHKVDASLISPPAVKSISFVSSPTRGDTYERGEKIWVLVQFDRAVTVTGRARVPLTIGEETRQAISSGWDTDPSLILFAEYIVQEDDRDEDGISIEADALALNGETIKGSDGTTDADLTHAAVAADGGRKVDGSLASPPAVTRISFMSFRGGDDTYELGETVEVMVEFDKPVTVTGAPHMALTIGDQVRHATYSTSWGDDRHAHFEYTVQEGDHDEDGISIPANALSLNGGTITAADGTADADLTHEAIAPERDRTVDGISDGTPPRVRAIYFDSSPAQGDTYGLGETIEVEVEFDGVVKATGEPRLALTIGTQTRHATKFGWSSHSLRFEYTVQEGDRDEDGISIPANALSLNGATITAPDGATEAVLTHEAVAAEGSSKVDGSDGTPPGVRAIRFGYSPPARGDTYELGETIEVEVEFHRAVTATGEPQVALTIGAETRHAVFSGWGRETLYFDYTVQAGDRDVDGISIPANALVLRGGTIKAADGRTDANLAHPAVADDGSRKVNASDVTPPRVRAIRFGYSPPARGDTYELGETVEVEVEFDRAVQATGDPQVTLTVGTETRHATIRGRGRDRLYFEYTVQAGDRDEDGISIPANALALNGGSITAADGTTDADLTHGTVAAEGDRKVNGSLASPPGVTHIYFGSFPARGNTYELGEEISVEVAFDKVVTVTGRPQVALTIGDETRYAASSPSWRDDRYVHFSYVVQEGDRDGDGISIPANALSLNGGSITAADGTTDADLTHAAVGPERDRKVDGSSDVAPPRVAAIYFDSSPARGDTHELGETIVMVVEFDRAVKATGEPRIALTIGPRTRHATKFGWSSHSLRFEYTVQEGDRDEDGISIPANALVLGSGAITAADGTTQADLTHAAVAERGNKVNGSLVEPPRVKEVAILTSPAKGDTYEAGEIIQVVAEFDRVVTVSGRPRIALTMGAETRSAAFSGWGTHSLYFEYIVREGDRDEDGISIPANALALNGGTIIAADGTTDADLTHGTVTAEGGRKVNGSLASPPKVTGIRFVSTPERGSTYELGERIRVGVDFDKVVTVSGRPQVALTIGTETRYAIPPGLWTRDSYVEFRYTVRKDDRDEDGISIPANTLALNGGAITAADGTTDADLTHAAVGPERDGKVNGGTEVTPPRVKAIYFVTSFFDRSPAPEDTYELGERIQVIVEFDGVVEATGDPQVALTIGAETRYATLSGWGSDRLYFSYSVQAEDRDDDGISIPANALLLNGATITAANGSTRADLTHSAVAAEGGGEVNGSLVTQPRVTGISFSFPEQRDTYARGETIEVRVRFNRTVTVSGTPRAALTIGAHMRNAAYSESLGDYAIFRYVVQEDDLDEDGISIPANALLLNGGSITAADGSTDADLTHGAVAADPTRMVDGSEAAR